MQKSCVISFALLAAIVWSGNRASEAQNVLAFTGARGNPAAEMTNETNCNFSTTYRSYWVDPSTTNSTPQQIGGKLMEDGAVLTEFSGWTLDKRAILTVGYYLDLVKRCKLGNPYPFVYESCVCTLDPNDKCDCPTKRAVWPSNPPNHRIGLQQVPADPSYYYFAAGHMVASGCADCYVLFRMKTDSTGLFQMAGATAHGVVASPSNRGVYALDGVGGITSGHTCVIIRKDQAPAGQYFTDCGGPEKNVYAAWAPDGTRLVFARESTDPFRLSVAVWNDEPQKIFVHDLTNAADFAADIAHNSSLIAWSSDSNWIYFSSYGRSSNEIVRVEVLKNGNASRRQRLVATNQLTRYPHRAYPNPSPDGKFVAFTASSDTGPWQLFVTDLQNLKKGPTSLLSSTWIGSDAFLSYPSWRP